MSIHICSRCQKSVPVELDGDTLHRCNSRSSAVNVDAVRVIGDYEDEDTGEIVKVPNALIRGTPNRLLHSRAGIEGERASALVVSADGAFPAGTHRLRQHYEPVGDNA